MNRPNPRDYYRPTMLQRATPGVVKYIEALEDYCDSLEPMRFKCEGCGAMATELVHTADDVRLCGPCAFACPKE